MTEMMRAQLDSVSVLLCRVLLFSYQLESHESVHCEHNRIVVGWFLVEQ